MALRAQQVIDESRRALKEGTHPFYDKDGRLRPLPPYLIPFVSGFLGGVADTIINFPPYGLHYRLQREEIIDPRINPRVYTPRELYRGVLAYGAIIPVTLIADGVATYLNNKGLPLPVATFLSGMLGALIITAPTSNVIINQQEGKLSATQAMRNISQHGWYRYTTGTSLYLFREGIYSTSVFFARKWLAKQHKIFEHKILNATVIGLVAAILTQPLDTTATSMIKRTVTHNFRESPVQTARRMYQEGGLRKFYKGFWFRAYAISAGILVMGEVSDYVKAELGEKEEQQEDEKEGKRG